MKGRSFPIGGAGQRARTQKTRLNSILQDRSPCHFTAFWHSQGNTLAPDGKQSACWPGSWSIFCSEAAGLSFICPTLEPLLNPGLREILSFDFFIRATTTKEKSSLQAALEVGAGKPGERQAFPVAHWELPNFRDCVAHSFS